MTRPLNPWKLSGYKPGQNVWCKVVNAEAGGYAVLVSKDSTSKDNLPGYLPTQQRLKAGEEILATFVCVHKNRILLTARFGNSQIQVSGGAPQQTPNWQDQLEQIGYDNGESGYGDQDSSGQYQAAIEEHHNDFQTQQQAFHIPAQDQYQTGHHQSGQVTPAQDQYQTGHHQSNPIITPQSHQIQPRTSDPFAPPPDYNQQQSGQFTAPQQAQYNTQQINTGPQPQQYQEQYATGGQPAQYQQEQQQAAQYNSGQQGAQQQQQQPSPSYNGGGQQNQYAQQPPQSQWSGQQNAAPDQQYNSGQQAQYNSGQQAQYNSGQQAQYNSGQQAQYAQPNQNQYQTQSPQQIAQYQQQQQPPQQADPAQYQTAPQQVQNQPPSQYQTGPQPDYQSAQYQTQQQYQQPAPQGQYQTGPQPAQVQYQTASHQPLEQPPQQQPASSAVFGAPPSAPQAQPQLAPQPVSSPQPQYQQSQQFQTQQSAPLPVPAPPQPVVKQPSAPGQPHPPGPGVTTKKFQLRRAIDLMMPPVQPDSINTFKIADYDLEWLITDLEGGMRTGCVKASSEQKLSRSAMLLYRGRAVGCIYGCKASPETLPTEQSLPQMLADLEMPDAIVSLYDLPENVTLAMSALFLGYPVQRSDDYDARSYMDYICSWFESKGQTACLAITLPSNKATCLGYVYKGQFAGAFYVEDQKFTTDKNFVYELLRNDPNAGVEASILPPEMTSSTGRFGYSLSMAKQRKD